MNVENVQAVVQVVAQLAFGDGIFGNFVGCSEHAHVHGGLNLAAQAAKFVVFEHAQQLGLGVHRHLTNLIEQQRTFFRQFEAAGPSLQRAGEGAFFVSEDLAFDESLRNS